jgi:ATP-dependent Clp protease ATP-binding subunit ClpA
MSEFMEKALVSKLIARLPAMWVTKRGGQLTEKVKRAPYSIILLDEIEKAIRMFTTSCCKFIEDGQLTDGPRQYGGFQEHHHHHDFEPGRAVP